MWRKGAIYSIQSCLRESCAISIAYCSSRIFFAELWQTYLFWRIFRVSASSLLHAAALLFVLVTYHQVLPLTIDPLPTLLILSILLVMTKY